MHFWLSIDTSFPFPSAVVYDENGTPMHSWRALITPYMDLPKDMKYDFSEAWNGPNNARLMNRISAGFSSRSDDDSGRSSTSFVALVGPATVWIEERPSSGRAATTDPSIMVIDLEPSGINWLEPRDISATDVGFQLLERFNRKSVNFVTSDGRVGTLYTNQVVFRGSESDLLRYWSRAR
ncbi:MAG: hypothetical protein ACKV0T_18470 [Planctomycetales bacterium]